MGFGAIAYCFPGRYALEPCAMDGGLGAIAIWRGADVYTSGSDFFGAIGRFGDNGVWKKKSKICQMSKC